MDSCLCWRQVVVRTKSEYHSVISGVAYDVLSCRGVTSCVLNGVISGCHHGGAFYGSVFD